MNKERKTLLPAIGYFDGPAETPTHDPGIEVDCPLCNAPLSQPMKAISLIAEDGLRSYFYRAHKVCYTTASEEEVLELEGRIIDEMKGF